MLQVSLGIFGRILIKLQFRLTMAAIDPSAEPEHTGTVNGDTVPRATLKLVYDRSGSADDEDSETDSEGGADDQNFLEALLRGKESDEDDEDEEDESSSDDEEINGGPSDPSKSKKARRQAAAEQLMKALAEAESEDEMDVDGVNGTSTKKRNKGKGKAMSEEDEEDSEEEGDDDSNMEEVVVCTLDPQKVGCLSFHIFNTDCFARLTITSRTTNNLLT